MFSLIFLDRHRLHSRAVTWINRKELELSKKKCDVMHFPMVFMYHGAYSCGYVTEQGLRPSRSSWSRTQRAAVGRVAFALCVMLSAAKEYCSWAIIDLQDSPHWERDFKLLAHNKRSKKSGQTEVNVCDYWPVLEEFGLKYIVHPTWFLYKIVLVLISSVSSMHSLLSTITLQATRVILQIFLNVDRYTRASAARYNVYEKNSLLGF